MTSLYSAWLKMIKGVNSLRYDLLVGEFGDAHRVFEAAAGGAIMPSKRIPDAVVRELELWACQDGLDKTSEILHRSGIKVISVHEPDYPYLLKNILDPPPVLFVRGHGDIKQLDRAIAIVGSRSCTDYGRQMANRFGHQLAERDVTVVSGLAFGIDAAAHKGALMAKEAVLPTVAVLAGGADVPYPMENCYIYDQILERGFIVSEMPPKTPVIPRMIPQRNRIIAGMCQGTLVAQAKRKSGTWHTINYAVENGRDVFVLPGMVDDPTCEGSNLMIKQGAFLTTEVNDIISYYDGWDVKKIIKSTSRLELTPDENAIIRWLKESDKSADQLAECTGIPVNRLLSLLTNLTRQGIIERKSYMQYHYIKED